MEITVALARMGDGWDRNCRVAACYFGPRAKVVRRPIVLVWRTPDGSRALGRILAALFVRIWCPCLGEAADTARRSAGIIKEPVPSTPVRQWREDSHEPTLAFDQTRLVGRVARKGAFQSLGHGPGERANVACMDCSTFLLAALSTRALGRLHCLWRSCDRAVLGRRCSCGCVCCPCSCGCCRCHWRVLLVAARVFVGS